MENIHLKHRYENFTIHVGLSGLMNSANIVSVQEMGHQIMPHTHESMSAINNWPHFDMPDTAYINFFIAERSKFHIQQAQCSSNQDSIKAKV